MSDQPPNIAVSKMESRWMAALTALAVFFGGWWLQNQYETTLRLQEQLAEYMRFVDDKYVQKDYLSSVENRLERIDRKLDEMRDGRGSPDK